MTHFRDHAADFLRVWKPLKVVQLSEPERLERLTRFAGNASRASNLLQADHLFLLRRCSHRNMITPRRQRDSDSTNRRFVSRRIFTFPQLSGPPPAEIMWSVCEAVASIRES